MMVIFTRGHRTQPLGGWVEGSNDQTLFMTSSLNRTQDILASALHPGFSRSNGAMAARRAGTGRLGWR